MTRCFLSCFLFHATIGVAAACLSLERNVQPGLSPIPPPIAFRYPYSDILLSR